MAMYSTSSILRTHKFDMTILGIYLLLLVAYCTPTVSFTVSSCVGGAKGRRSYTHFAIIGNDEDDKKKTNKMGDDGFVPAEEQSVDYTGSVDWDAEWKKVVKNQDKIARDRPGKDFYKSEAEIAAIRAANQATEQAARLAAKVPSVPSWEVLKGDWRFWIGIIAVLSIGASLISAVGVQSTMPNNADPGSFYI